MRTTQRGLPLQIEFDQQSMTAAPAQLAQDVLALCQLAARRAQVARRRELSASGVDAAIIRGLDLSTEDELLLAEARLRAVDDDSTPHAWLRHL